MKRVFAVIGIFFFCWVQVPAFGQDTAATTAAAVAEKEGLDEKFKQMTADIETLRAANQALLDKISNLKEELQQVRGEQSRLANNSSIQDALKLLATKIEEVDKKRQDDKDLISEEIKKSTAKLEKLLTGPGATTPVSPGRSVETPETPVKDGVVYIIKSGETLDAIVKAYNADFKSKGLKQITLKQAMEANPLVDWTKTKPGQKIVIPLPPK